MVQPPVCATHPGPDLIEKPPTTMTAMRSTAVLALAVAAACSSDGPTRPSSDRLASQLSALADSSESAGPFGFALHSAAAILEAGGSITGVTIQLDGVPEQFDAVAFRTSWSEQACEQLVSGFGGMGLGFDSTLTRDTSIVVEDNREEFLCAPSQSLVAWQGDPVRRIVVVEGDTGTSTIGGEEWAPWTFFALYFDRDDRADWWLNAGTKQASLLSDNGACRQAPRPAPGDVACRLATLQHGFDLEMHQYSWDEAVFPVLPPVRGSAMIGDTVVYSDTVIFSDSITWTPPTPHTMRMAPRPISGLSMTITNIDMRWMNGRVARAFVARSRAASR